MARVALVEESRHPELAELVAKIRGARGGRLINIYRLMLHSPPLASAWFELNQAARYQTKIDGQCRELAIIRVAILNNAEYVMRAHVPGYALKEGLSQAQLDTVSDWRASNAFSACQRALLAYVDSMTREIDVSEEVFENLKIHFDERQIVELTVLVGAYNMLTRFLKALRVDLEPTGNEAGRSH
jgi:4-carboxymuconolactone decarboxylase